MKVECALGEVVDKLTILRIKEERLPAPARIDVRREIAALLDAWSAEIATPVEAVDGYADLDRINRALWEVEDALRDCEARSDFGERFVALARSVYRLNDQRADCKRRINLALGSRLIEHKSYGAGRPT